MGLMTIQWRRWYQSRVKWEKIVKALERRDEPAFYGAMDRKCGYCDQAVEEAPLGHGAVCSVCPLRVRRVCYDTPRRVAYWTVVNARTNRQKLAAAKKVLAAIMEDDRWKEGSK